MSEEFKISTAVHSLGYEPIRAFIRERLKSVTNDETRKDLEAIVTLCNGLEHQAELLDVALASGRRSA